MKILVFTSLYPNNVWPHHGVFIKERMTKVAQLDGCQVQVVAPTPYFPPLKLTSRWHFSQVLRHEVIEGLDVYHPWYFMTPKVGMISYGITLFLSVLPVVKKIQQHFDFDLIDAHYVYPDGFAAILLGQYFKKPVVISARGSDVNLFSQFPLIRRLLRYSLRRADQVIAVSQALQEKIEDLGIPSQKISVIPNGVDLEKFYPCDREQAQKLLGLTQERVILSVGHLKANKGFELLLNAFRILLDRFRETNVGLVIVGDGPFRTRLEELISLLQLETRVRLVGNVQHNKLYLWYNAADLFCLASEREGWPNVLLETLACGTPVVATPVGGIPEIIQSEDIGILVHRTEHEIARGLALALQKQWQPEMLTQYARQYTWDRAASSVFQVFVTALQGNLSQMRIPEKNTPSFPL